MDSYYLIVNFINRFCLLSFFLLNLYNLKHDAYYLNLPNIYNSTYLGYWGDCGTHKGLLAANNYYLERNEESG